ncbi:hypothetical protein [Ottowia sp. VDI28]|uniref:hypothetical protein n=1 Tax=Ottowia sp. VDI28 TaxID=3133968 RepID=UPI003C2F6C8B
MDAQQQEQAAFESSFAESAGAAAPAPAPAEPVAEAPVPAPAPAEAAAPAAEEPAAAPAAPDGEAANAPAPAPEEDPEVFDGFKRSEVKRLFAQAAKVESLESQLRKANGKIGELNGRLQTPAAPAPAPTPAPAPELSPEMRQFEQDYPDVAKYVRGLGITPAPQPQAAPPAEVQQPVATGSAPEPAELDPVAMELAVMDRIHKGWREKVQGEEFVLWLASQDEKVQQDYQAATTVDGLSAVIGQYDQWATARTAAADKAAKGQQKLKNAVTPNGNAPRPQTALTEQQAFEAALKG